MDYLLDVCTVDIHASLSAFILATPVCSSSTRLYRSCRSALLSLPAPTISSAAVALRTCSSRSVDALCACSLESRKLRRVSPGSARESGDRALGGHAVSTEEVPLSSFAVVAFHPDQGERQVTACARSPLADTVTCPNASWFGLVKGTRLHLDLYLHQVRNPNRLRQSYY